MTSVIVYDTEAKELEHLAEKHDTSIAEIVGAMLECFYDNDGEDYI